MFEDILEGWGDLEEALEKRQAPEEEQDANDEWDAGGDSDNWSTGDSVEDIWKT